MQAHLQGVEGEAPVDLDHQFAVEDEHVRLQPAQEGDDLREEAPERLAGFRPYIDFVAGLERKAAKAVPLRLILPCVAARKLGRGSGLHRRRADGQGKAARLLCRA